MELLDQADQILSPILVRLEEEAIAILGENWAKTWHLGLPKPEETPGGMNIPAILWWRNLALSYDLVDYGKMRYALLGNASHWFPGNKSDRLDELDLQPCLKNSPHANKIPSFLAEAHQMFGDQEIKRLSQQ